MDLSKELLSVLVDAQLLHLQWNNDTLVDHGGNYLRKVVVYCGQILEKNESVWGCNRNKTTANQGYQIDRKLVFSIFKLLITEYSLNHNLDKEQIVNEILYYESSSNSFIETLETLMQSCLLNRVDFKSYFRLVHFSGMNGSSFFSELCAHFALNRFRISKGYMGLTPGNYIPHDQSRNWHDLDCAIASAFSIGKNVNAIDLIRQELDRIYSQTVLAPVTQLRKE